MANNINNKGFTIIELLISTAILSTILLMSTFVLMGIGRLYYKGINQSRIQNANRSIASEISQRLQVSDQSTATVVYNPATKLGAICMGDYRYTYQLGKTLKEDGSITDTANQSPHVLWREKITSLTVCTPPVNYLSNAAPNQPGFTSDGSELMVINGRLTQLNLNGTSPFTLQIGSAYGDFDLLTATDGANVRCRGGSTSDQFCATTYLQTTVAKRLR